MTKLIEMRALALKFLGLTGLFIILSSAISADSARLTQEGFRYSTYLATLPDAKNANNFQGSFIVQTQPTGLFHTTAQNIYTEASAEVSNLPIRESILGYLIDNKEITYDYETVWRTRGWNVIRSATNKALLSATESSRRTGLIRTLELDVQSELGGRRANIGLSALGGLRETDNDVIAWQLRGYRTSDDAGANAGLIYRRATENNLLVGANVFLDYETHDVENFWRYSIGGELRSPWIDIFANTYIGITDPVESSEGTTYTSDGHDVELNVHSPDISWLTGKVTYYNFSGEFGDEDQEGVRFGLRFSPRQVPFVLEIEYEDADEGEESVGGRISYTHVFGVPNGGNQSRSGKFTPRDWFYAPVEREYTQRIRTGGGGSNSRSITLMAQVPPGFGVRIFNNSLSLAIVIARGDANNEYSISGTGERGVTLQPLTISMISLEQALVWPIPTEHTVILESDTPINVSFLNGAITTYIGSTVIMHRDSIGLINGIITVATGGGFTSEFLAFQGRLTAISPTLTGVRIDLSGEPTTVSFEHIGNVKLFAGNPTFIIDGEDAESDGCGGEIPVNNNIDFRCPIDGPVFVVGADTYISEPDTTLLRVQSSGNLGALVTYLENRNPRLDLPFARLMTVNGGSGGRISYTTEGNSPEFRVEPNGDIYLVDAAATVNFPRGANERNQLMITIVATANGVPVEEISPLTVVYIVDVNSQSITPFAVNLLGENRSVPQNGNTEATPILINDAANNLALAVVNINANGGIVLDASAGDANYSYTRLDSAGNATSDNTPAGNLNLVSSQIVIPQITEASLIRENSVLGITVLVEDIADAAPNIADYTENFVLTLFVILGPIRTDPIVIQFTPINTYAGTTSDGEFRYTATGNNIRINYPYDSTRRSQSTSEEHRDLGRVMMTGGSGFNAAQIQSSGNGIEADIAADGLSPNGNDQTNLTLRIPNNADVDTEQWVVQVTAEDPIAANRTIEYRVDAIRDIGGVADERAASAPENSIVQRDGAYRYRYFTAIATLNGINASDYPQDVVQLGEGEGGRGSINNVLVNSDAPLRYNPATRIISFASEPDANNYEIVVRYTDSDSAAGTNPFLVTVNITTNNDLVNITLGSVADSTVSGNLIRTPLLDVADPRGHIANIALSNVTVSGVLALDTSKPGSLEYVQGADITSGMIFSPDNQFAGGVIDYANEVVRHSIFINAIDNAISVTISYEIRAELTFDTPVPSPLGESSTFDDDPASGIDYTYSGDHDNGISIRVNYPYDGNWAEGSTDADRALINIGGEISVFLDTVNQPQAIFAHDDNGTTDGVIRLVSETPPADTIAPYTFNYVPYNSAKGLNGITNEITFLAVEDIGGVTDEIAADAVALGSIVQRGSAYNYGYFIALSTLGGITTDYPHDAVQLGTGDGGSGNISSSMVSRSDSRVEYDTTTRIISFRSVPEVTNYEMVIRFRDDEARTNLASDYLVTVSIVANNDLVNITLGNPTTGAEISGNVIRTTLLNVADPRGHIANIGLLNVTVGGTLQVDPSKNGSLEYVEVDITTGMVFSPDNQFADGVIDYANEVVRHSLFVLAIDNGINVTVPYMIRAELSFDTPAPAPLGEISTFDDSAPELTYTYSGDHDNGISIRVNYPYDGNWAAGSTDAQRAFMNIGSSGTVNVEISVLLDSTNQAIFAYDETDEVIRLVSETPPTETVDAYTFNYVPYNATKGLEGITNTITFLGVEDIGGVTDEIATDAPAGVVQQSSAYNYGYFIALSTLAGPLLSNYYPHDAIQLGTGLGGSGDINSSLVSSSDSRVEYDSTTRRIRFVNAPAADENYNIVIRFTDNQVSANDARPYTVTVNIAANDDLINIGLTDTNGDTIEGNVITIELLGISAPRTPIATVSLVSVTVGNLVLAPGDHSLEYEQDSTDNRKGIIYLPADLLVFNGVTLVDYENEVIRRELVLLATDTDRGIANIPSPIIVLLTFATPTGNPQSTAPVFVADGRRYTYDDSTIRNGISIRINYPNSGIWAGQLAAGNILNFAVTNTANIEIDFGVHDEEIFDRVGNIVRITVAQAPEDTAQEYTFTYFPRDTATGLEGVTSTVKLVAVPDVGVTEQLTTLSYIDGRDGEYRYLVPVALTATALAGGSNITSDPIITYTPSGGSNSFTSGPVGTLPTALRYTNNRLFFTRELTESSSEIGTTLTAIIAFSETNVGLGANSFTSTVTIEPTTVILDIIFTSPIGTVEIDNFVSEPLPVGAGTNTGTRNLAAVRFVDRSIRSRTSKVTGSLEYNTVNNFIILPADIIGTGDVDYDAEVIRHSVVIEAENIDTGARTQIVYNIEFTFDRPEFRIGGNNDYTNPRLGLNYQADFPAFSSIGNGVVNIRINYPAGGEAYNPDGTLSDGDAYFFITDIPNTGFRIFNEAGGFVDSRTIGGDTQFINIGGVEDFARVAEFPTSDLYRWQLASNTTPANTTQPFDIVVQPYNYSTGLEGQTVTIRIRLIEDIAATTSPLTNPLANAVLRGGDNNTYRYVVPNANVVGDGTGSLISVVSSGGSGTYASRIIGSSPSLVYDTSTQQVAINQVPTLGGTLAMTIGVRDSNPSVGSGNEYTLAITMLTDTNAVNFRFVDLNGNEAINDVVNVDLADVSGGDLVARADPGANVRVVALGSSGESSLSRDFNNRNNIHLPSDVLSGPAGRERINGTIEHIIRLLVVSEDGSGNDIGSGEERRLTVRVNYPPVDVVALDRGSAYNSDSLSTDRAGLSFIRDNTNKRLELRYNTYWEALSNRQASSSDDDVTDHRNPVLFDVGGGSGTGGRNTRRVEFVSMTPRPTGNYLIQTVRSVGTPNGRNGFRFFHSNDNLNSAGTTGFGEFANGRRLAFVIPDTREIGVPPNEGPYVIALRVYDNNVRVTTTVSFTFNAIRNLNVAAPVLDTDFVNVNANNPNDFIYVRSNEALIGDGGDAMILNVGGGTGGYGYDVDVTSTPSSSFATSTPTYTGRSSGTAPLRFGFTSTPDIGRYTVNIRVERADSSSGFTRTYVINVVENSNIEGRLLAISPEGVTNTITNINGATLSLNVGDLSGNNPIAYIDTPQALTLSVTFEGDLNILSEDNRVIVLPNFYPLNSGEADDANNLIRSSIIVSVPDEIYGLGTLMLTLFVETHYESRIFFSPAGLFTQIVPALGLTTRIEFRELSPTGGWEVRYPPGLSWNRISPISGDVNNPGVFSDILGEKVTGTSDVAALVLREPASSSSNSNGLILELREPAPTESTVIEFTLNVGGQAFPQTLFVVEEILQVLATTGNVGGGTLSAGYDDSAIRVGETASGETFYRIIPSRIGTGAPSFRININGGSGNYLPRVNLLGTSLSSSSGAISIDELSDGSGDWDITFLSLRSLPRVSQADFHVGRVYTLRVEIDDEDVDFVNATPLELLIMPTDFEDAGVEVNVNGRNVATRIIQHPLFAISDIEDNRVIASIGFRPGAEVNLRYNLGGNPTTVNLSTNYPNQPGVLNFFDNIINNNGLIRFNSDVDENVVTGTEIDSVNSIIEYVATLAITDPTAFEADTEVVTIQARATYRQPTVTFIPGGYTNNNNDFVELGYEAEGIQIVTEGTTIRAIYPPNRPLGWFWGPTESSQLILSGVNGRSVDRNNGILGEFYFTGGDVRPSMLNTRVDGINFNENVFIPPIYYLANSNIIDRRSLVTHYNLPLPIATAFQSHQFTLRSTRKSNGIPVATFYEEEWTFEAVEGIQVSRVTTGELSSITRSGQGVNHQFIRQYDLNGEEVFRYSISDARFDAPAFRVSVAGTSGSYTGSARIAGQPDVRFDVRAVAGSTDVFDVYFLSNPASISEEDFVAGLLSPANLIVSIEDDAARGGSSQVEIRIVPTASRYSGYTRDETRNGNFGNAITVSLNYNDYVAGMTIANVRTRTGGGSYTSGEIAALVRGIAIDFSTGDVTLASLERFLEQADVDPVRNVLTEDTGFRIQDNTIFGDGRGSSAPGGGSTSEIQFLRIYIEVHYEVADISFTSETLFQSGEIIIDDSLEASNRLLLNYPLNGEWTPGTAALQIRGGIFSFTQGEGDLGALATNQNLAARLTSGNGIDFVLKAGSETELEMRLSGTAPRGENTYQIEVDLVQPGIGVIDRQVFDLRIIEGFTFTDNIITPPTGNQPLVQFGGDLSDSPYYRYITPNHNTAGGINYNIIGGSGNVAVNVESNPSGVPITYVPAQTRLSFDRAIRADELFSVTVRIADTTQGLTLTSAFVIEGSDQRLNIEFIDISTNQFFETDTLRRDIELRRSNSQSIFNQRIEIAQITVYGDLPYSYTKLRGGLNIEASGRISTPVDRSLGGEIDYTDPDGDGHGEVLQSVVFEMSDGTNTQLATLYAELLFNNPRGLDFDLRQGSRLYSIEGSSGPRNFLLGDVHRSYTIWITYPNGNQDWVSGPIGNDFTQNDTGGNLAFFSAAGGADYQWNRRFNNDVLGYYNIQTGGGDQDRYLYIRNRPTPSSESAVLAVTVWESLAQDEIPAQVTGTIFIYAVEDFATNQSIHIDSTVFMRRISDTSYRYVLPRATETIGGVTPPANRGIGSIIGFDISGGSGDLDINVSTSSSGVIYNSRTQEIRTTRRLTAGDTVLFTLVVSDNNENFRVPSRANVPIVFTIFVDEDLVDVALLDLEGNVVDSNILRVSRPSSATVSPIGQVGVTDPRITDFSIVKLSGGLLYNEITRIVALPDNLNEGSQIDQDNNIVFSATFLATNLETGDTAEISASAIVGGGGAPSMRVGANGRHLNSRPARFPFDLAGHGIGYNISNGNASRFSIRSNESVTEGSFTYLINTFYNGLWSFPTGDAPMEVTHNQFSSNLIQFTPSDNFRILGPNGEILAQQSNLPEHNDFVTGSGTNIPLPNESGNYSGWRIQQHSSGSIVMGPGIGEPAYPPADFENFIIRMQPFNPVGGIDGATISITIRLLEDVAIFDDIAAGVNYLGNIAGGYTYFTALAPASGAGIDLNPDGGTGTYDVVATVPAGGPITYNEAEERLDFSRALADGDVYTVTVIASEGGEPLGYGDIPFPSTLFITITASDTSFATDIVEGLSSSGTNIVTGMTITRVLSAAAGSAIALARIDEATPASGAITKEEGSLRINSSGLISLPTAANQITAGIIDYEDDVIRHYIVLNAVQNNVTIQTRLDVELSFTQPALMVHAPDSAFTDRLAELSVTINDFTTGEILNGEISIQINYPNGGPWGGDESLGSDDNLREFIGLSGANDAVATGETFYITDANGVRITGAADLDSTPYTVINADGRASALQAANNTTLGRNVIRLLDGTPPADTREPYEMYIRPVHGNTSLVGEVITLKLYAVEGVGVDSYDIATDSLVRANSIYELNVDNVVGYPVAILTINSNGGINTGSGVDYDVSISVDPSGNDDAFIYSAATRRLFVNRPLDSRQTYTLSLGISSGGFGAAPFSGSLTIGFTGSCENDKFHADRQQVYSDVGSLSGLYNEAIAPGVGMPGSRSLLFLDEDGTSRPTSAVAPILGGDFSTTFLGNPLVIRIFQIAQGTTRTGLGTRIAIGNAYVDNFAVYTETIPESSGRYTLITYYSRATEETRVATAVEGVNGCPGSPVLDNLPLGQFIFSGQGEFVRTGGGELGELSPILMDVISSDEGIIDPVSGARVLRRNLGLVSAPAIDIYRLNIIGNVAITVLEGSTLEYDRSRSIIQIPDDQVTIGSIVIDDSGAENHYIEHYISLILTDNNNADVMTTLAATVRLLFRDSSRPRALPFYPVRAYVELTATAVNVLSYELTGINDPVNVTAVYEVPADGISGFTVSIVYESGGQWTETNSGGVTIHFLEVIEVSRPNEIIFEFDSDIFTVIPQLGNRIQIGFATLEPPSDVLSQYTITARYRRMNSGLFVNIPIEIILNTSCADADMRPYYSSTRLNVSLFSAGDTVAATSGAGVTASNFLWRPYGTTGAGTSWDGSASALASIPVGAEISRTLTESGVSTPEDFLYIKSELSPLLLERRGYACEGELPAGNFYVDSSVTPTSDHSEARP